MLTKYRKMRIESGDEREKEMRKRRRISRSYLHKRKFIDAFEIKDWFI